MEKRVCGGAGEGGGGWRARSSLVGGRGGGGGERSRLAEAAGRSGGNRTNGVVSIKYADA